MVQEIRDKITEKYYPMETKIGWRNQDISTVLLLMAILSLSNTESLFVHLHVLHLIQERCPFRILD